MRALIVVGLILFGHLPANADPKARDHGSPGAIENARSGPREIPDYLLKYISSTFDLPISYVKERWKDDGLDGPDSLMSAVRDMEKGDDTRIAKILAQLIGTLNPKSSETVFQKTRDLFIEETTNPTPRTPYANLMERVLFGLYAWPTDKSKAPVFCQKPIAAVKKSEKAATVHTKWEKDLDDAYAKALQGDKDTKPDAEAVTKSITEDCFGKTGEKFNNETYGKFWEKFDPAASEVFAKNEEYHKKADEFSAAKDEPTKAKLAQEISAKWNQDSLSAYAGQQTRSGWAEEKDGKKIAEVRADAALRAAAWAQNGFAKPANFVLKDPGGKEISIEVKPDVLMGVALKEKIAELEKTNGITKPEVGPYDLRPASAKPAVAQVPPTQPTEQPVQFDFAKEMQGKPIPKIDSSKTDRDQSAIASLATAYQAGLNDPAKSAAAGKHVAGGKCISCHNAQKDSGSGLTFDASGAVLNYSSKPVKDDPALLKAALDAILARAVKPIDPESAMPPKAKGDLTWEDKAKLVIWAQANGVEFKP